MASQMGNRGSLDTSRVACSNRRPRACVERVIREHHTPAVEARWLRLIPGCESSWIPTERSGPNVGLYQFNESTWAATPYAARDPFQAYWSTRAAAWGYVHLEHGKYEWECTTILGLG